MTRLLLIITVLLVGLVPARAATEIEEVVTPDGITFWLTEEPSIPIVSLEIRIEGGSSLDPIGKEGLAVMVMSLLEEGAGDLDNTEFATRLEELAAAFTFEANRDSVTISATMLRENRQDVAELLRLAVQEPRFDADALQRVTAQLLSIIRSEETNPDRIASQRFFELAFPDHPYARPTNGTFDSVTTFTTEDLAQHHAELLVQNRVLVSVVGAVSAEEASALVDTVVSDLPVGGLALPEPADIALDGGVHVFDLPSPQSDALFGHVGLARDDPDFIPAFVMNRILGGGGFTSRLTSEVREERGLTYGISTFLAPLEYAPLYLGSVSSANETMAEAIEIVRAEWARLADGGVTEQELDAAKRFLTGAYPLRFDTNAKIADILVGVQAGELGIDYTQRRNSLIEAVTLDDVSRVARRLLDADALTFVVVGQPEGLE
ncbi:M16 family metallopeptidase [Pontivivens insulae]|uniref:Putative zinc protease n=1 Tax=Pontivivens insulae TaxID=1639689 RepID=A0A2R8A8A8_9RHOB|nr:pitrilysin family protein [Pontivivens insulae]RED18558.1 zinc protease [Pontivivens insulae]SPF28456.1 putative zinc protease [Pontivivens insulae]